MEDYKKKYEQALKRAIKWASQPTVWSSDDICQKIFPELKESWDDVMRKMAIKAVYAPEAQSCIKSWGVEPKDVIAWLEKQGEQKPLNKVEQEDVELTDFESALFSAFSDAWQEYLSGKEVNVAKWAREHSAELLEFAREQKPTWSEDDEMMIENIFDTINDYYYAISDYKEMLYWLKSLKERYTWKPSDEQMKALNYVVNLMASSENPTENDYYYNLFKDMRTQLKKLKE